METTPPPAISSSSADVRTWNVLCLLDEAAARREGMVSWYTSTPVKAAQYIATEFERRFAIKVELLRTGGQNVIRRFQQEADAGRVAVDVITMSDMSAANAMTRRGLFVPFKLAGFDKVIPSAKDPNGYYVAQRLTLVGMVARTDKVAAADMPKQWTDLTLPKYKGQLVMADPSFTAIQLMVVATLSRKFGWQFYEGLRKNDTLIVQGHEQVYDMLKQDPVTADIPVIFVTADPGNHEFKKRDINHYIAKPFELDDLLAHVAAICRPNG